MGMELGGDALEEATATLTADLMHICKRRGISREEVLKQGRDQFEREEVDVTC